LKTILLAAFCFISCYQKPIGVTYAPPEIKPDSSSMGSWAYFLQHLPESKGDILDYQGNPVSNQAKHFSLINYDVGTKDLQQCADALIRLRAEYLFSRQRFADIGFHFTNGDYYDWEAYCRGIRPAYTHMRNGKTFATTERPVAKTHQTLRAYLNIVYTYAGTVSLCRELKPTNKLEIGTIVIAPGSPGHCSMIVNKAVFNKTDTLYKLAEGYMPAQSIYILANPYEPDLSPWYHLSAKTISTASCTFSHFYLRKFE
jgi:hypothetical protein